MRRTITALILSACAFQAAIAGSPIHFVEIEATEPWQRDAVLAVGLDGCDMEMAGDHAIRAFVTDDQRVLLRERGLEFTEIEFDRRGLTDVDGYLTLAEYEAAMASWAADHSDIVDLFSLGQTWEGREIWMLRISDNAQEDEDEPEALMISLQHAREWLSGMTLLGITQHLIDAYGSDPQVTDLVDSMEIHVVLVANPDGYAFTHSTQRFWRKNRRDNGDTTFGVDTNRNWEWRWETASDDTSSNTYRGPAPLSEPETQALNDWVSAPGRNLIGMLNYHTYGTRIMHNWAYTFDLPSNADVMGALARDMADAIEGVNGQRMRNGSWAITLGYTGGGSTIDHFQAVLGIPALTFELRPGDGASGGFAPPGSSIAPSQSENIDGALVFLEWARALATDLTAPVISDLAVSRISNTEATITWTTDDPATHTVHLGTTSALGASQEPDGLRGINHEVRLTGLAPNTVHFARAVSENTAGLSASSELVTFTTAATAQDITPPTAPAFDVIRTAGGATLEFTWLPLGGEALSGHRLHESGDGETWTLIADESTLPAGVTSHQMPAPSPGEVRLYRLTNVDQAAVPNESPPSDTYALMTDGGSAPLLIVDGYDRWNSRAAAQGLNHEFAADHGVAVATHGVAFDTCRNEMVGTQVDLADYEAVVWVLGDESTGNETFSASEQAAVAAHLEAGGDLFVSGSEIGWDLDRPTGPSGADRAFYNTYLGAAYAKDDIDDYDVAGTGGASVFSDRTVRFDEGSRGIYRVTSPDGVTPVNGAVAALESPQGEVCAVQRQGPVGIGVAESRLVYLAFPFETIFPASARAQVMGDALRFFGLVEPTEASGISTH